MSPALNPIRAELDTHLLTLAKGFDALLQTSRKLACQEQELRNKLRIANDEYSRLAEQLSCGSSLETQPLGESTTSAAGAKTDNVLETSQWVGYVAESGYASADELEAISKALDVRKDIIAKRSSGRDEHRHTNTCLVAANARAKSSLERDFTTNGVQGNLRCPFAISKEDGSQLGPLVNGDIEGCAHKALDPIKAEMNQNNPSRSVSGVDSVSRCPIRYLDDHSPEAVAQYFERHKHEIPRSHAICIQRYQRDTQSLRQLDEKYGNMVDMVKGLGMYHQPYLKSSHGQEKQDAPDSSSVARVEKWAEDVSAKSPQQDDPSESEETADREDRQGHFERPLRDVRVGESPSRPWGIHVPLSQAAAALSAVESPAAPEEPTEYGNLDEGPPLISTSALKQPTPGGGCPFRAPALNRDGVEAADISGVSLGAEADTKENRSHPPSTLTPTPRPPLQTQSHASPPPNPNMIFNGPVFFGYSAEQTAALLQQLGSAGLLK
ncbi:hypothetical protein AJ80_05006 [Polytolypa hystricis UAMH7299]|uniref:Uncharacterized protein n=1 Tax=Polytolypa hystricis (strain UAMH7299) TaxID=1447883 RepID=A0A2B7Y7N8_POLH7|nr:hypothetical protein AJ80_05006 [Polytolypa hystricis UAMH7299]